MPQSGIVALFRKPSKIIYQVKAPSLPSHTFNGIRNLIQNRYSGIDFAIKVIIQLTIVKYMTPESLSTDTCHKASREKGFRFLEGRK